MSTCSLGPPWPRAKDQACLPRVSLELGSYLLPTMQVEVSTGSLSLSQCGLWQCLQEDGMVLRSKAPHLNPPEGLAGEPGVTVS